MHHFKVVTYLKMGCPLSTEEVPLIMGNNAPYPQCHQWVQAAMAKLVADHPDYVFTTSTRPWNIKPGDVMPATYVGIWQTFADNNIPVLAMRDTPWLVKDGQPFIPADCLAKGGNPQSCGIARSKVLVDRNQPSTSLRGSRCLSHSICPTRYAGPTPAARSREMFWCTATVIT